MNSHSPEGVDNSQPEPELIIERVEKLYNEWLQRRNGAVKKLVRDDTLADQPDPKNEE